MQMRLYSLQRRFSKGEIFLTREHLLVKDLEFPNPQLNSRGNLPSLKIPSPDLNEIDSRRGNNANWRKGQINPESRSSA